MPRATKKTMRPAQNKRAEGRPARVPVGVNRDILTVDGKDDGYVYRWVNDTGTRVQKFIRGYWDIVEDDDLIIGTNAATIMGSNISTTVDNTTGVKAVLMRISKKYYDEDQQSKSDAIDATEEEIRKSVKKVDSNDVEHYGEADLKRKH